LCATKSGIIVNGFLTGGDAHDSKEAEELLAPVENATVLADRGYDCNRIRKYLEQKDCEAVIPGRKSRKKKIEYNRWLYRRRSYIEILFGKLKENRRLVVRYEKSDMSFLSMITIGFISMYL